MKNIKAGQIVYFVDSDWHNYVSQAFVLNVPDGNIDSETNINLQLYTHPEPEFSFVKKAGELYETAKEADIESEKTITEIFNNYKNQMPDVNALVRFMYNHNVGDTLWNNAIYEASNAVCERAKELLNIDLRNPTFEVDKWDDVRDSEGFDNLSIDEQNKRRSDQINKFKTSIVDVSSLVEFMYGYAVGENVEGRNVETQIAAVAAAKDLFGIDITKTPDASINEPSMLSFPNSDTPINKNAPTMSAHEQWEAAKVRGDVVVEWKASTNEQIDTIMESAKDLSDALDILQEENNALEI